MPALADYATLAAPPPVGQPRTVVGLLHNDPRALAAMGDAPSQPPYKGAPKAPVLYVKPANTHAVDGDAIVLPAGTDAVQIGATLAIEFARPATRVSVADALSVVAGYRLAIDVSIPHDSFYRPPLKQKCRDGFCPISAALVAAPDVADPDAARLVVRIDGQVCQEADATGFVRPVAQAIADVTAFMTLNPGDLLLLGVPHGAPLARAGQTVEVELVGIGRLTHRVVAEDTQVSTATTHPAAGGAA